MKTRFLKLTILTLLISLVLSCGCVSFAKEPFASYYLNGEIAMKIPAPYEVVTVIDFETTEKGRLNNPEDLFIGADDKIYVVDTGNNRIVVINPMDENGNYTLNQLIQGTSSYEEGDLSALKDPSGIFVDDDGSILVADKGNGRLVEYTQYGNFKFSYPKPASDLLSADFTYMPQKVTKDSRGYIFVANSSDSNGILMLDEDGSFRQYYGTNSVTLSLWESIAKLLWNRESRKGSIVTLPYTFNNIYSDGLYIYATTTTTTPPQVRKINAGGSDVTYAGYNFSDAAVAKGRNAVAQSFVDVTVDNGGNMLILDQQYGRIYEYDENGTNLFAFSTTGSGYGQLVLPCSIEVDSTGRIYVLNKQSGTITVFQTTEFADCIHQANRYYANGDYDKAFPLWQEVLDMDSYYTLALQNMGTIHMRQEDYDKAIEYYYDAGDAELASEAFEEIRSDYLRDHFAIIMTAVVIALVVLVVLSTVLRRRRKKRGEQEEKRTFLTPVKHFWKRLVGVLRHPIDTFEAIRYENQGSYGDMIVIMLFYTILSVISEYCVSFIYRGGSPLEFINPGITVAISLLPWLVICVVNYGVTTIMYGEGRFRDVLIGGAYCHTPLMLLILPLSLLTHWLTLQEQSLYNLIFTLIYIWIVILVYLCIKSVHGFHPVKALVVFFITAVGVAAVILLFLIVYGLAEQMFDFIFQFGKELSYLV